MTSNTQPLLDEPAHRLGVLAQLDDLVQVQLLEVIKRFGELAGALPVSPADADPAAA